MYEKHVFVCTNQRDDGRQSCGAAGAEIHGALKAQCRTYPELRGSLRVNKSGCLGLCKKGPAMVVYPETTWYAHVTKDDVKEIAEALKQGTVVERLKYEGDPAE